jgi:hypothetical protein
MLSNTAFDQEVARDRIPSAVDEIEAGGAVAGFPGLDHDRSPATSRVNDGAFEALDLE